MTGASPPENPHQVPQYLTYKVSVTLLELVAKDPSQAQIKICDFGESSFHDPSGTGTKRTLHCPRIYAAPEVIFDNWVSPASDVWAMGNLLHYILSGGHEVGRAVISARAHPPDEAVLKNMVWVLGKLPDPWWKRCDWAKRIKYFDKEGRWIKGNRRRSRLSRIPRAYLTEEENEVFEKVLRGMFDYNPGTRLTSKEVANSLDWLAT